MIYWYAKHAFEVFFCLYLFILSVNVFYLQVVPYPRVVVMASAEVLGCSHYQRKFKVIAPCCDTAYSCRFCHDEAEGHTVERRTVREVECLVCHLRQEVGPHCQATDCLTVFGAAYFCSVCKL